MVTQLVKADVQDAYRLYLRFEDGTEGSINIHTLTRFKGVFAPLQDSHYFEQVRIDPESGTVTWPNEADLDPLTLYARIKKLPLVFDRLIFYTDPLYTPENLHLGLEILDWIDASLTRNSERDAILNLTRFLQFSFHRLKLGMKLLLAIHKPDASFKEIDHARHLTIAFITYLSETETLSNSPVKQVKVQPSVLIDWPSTIPTQIKRD